MRRLVRAVLGVGTLLMGTLAVSMPAQAATYDGVNPETTVCVRTASTVRSAPLKINGRTVATVELRYSSGCRTVWGRIAGPSDDGTYGGVGAYVHRNSDGREYWIQWYSASCGCFWTPMLNDAGVTSYAAGNYNWKDGSVGWTRTASY